MDKNKRKALELLQKKSNREEILTYKQISIQTGYHEKSLIRLSKEIEKRDINSLLIHGQTGQPSHNSPFESELNFIIKFKEKYPECSISQFMDIFHEDVIWNDSMKDIVLKNNLKLRSYSFYCNLYKKQGWKSPIKHKSFGKKSLSHPLRDPSPRRGILIMIDGTPHDWLLNDIKFSLHLAIDDATGEVLAGWFMKEECLLGYCHLLLLVINEYGIPQSLYSDKHSILKSIIDGNLTTFGTIADDLGIELIFADSPEAKGKVERANGTIQRRLPNDIKRHNITTYSELNKFFNTKYKYYLNKKFSYLPKYKKSCFVKPTSKLGLEYIFTIRKERKVLSGNSISWNNNYYIPKDYYDDDYPFYKGTSVLVLQNVFNCKIYIKYRNVFYKTKQIEGHLHDLDKQKLKLIQNQKELDSYLNNR